MDEQEQEVLADTMIALLIEPTDGTEVFKRQFDLKHFGLSYRYPSHLAKGYVSAAFCMDGVMLKHFCI